MQTYETTHGAVLVHTIGQKSKIPQLEFTTKRSGFLWQKHENWLQGTVDLTVRLVVDLNNDAENPNYDTALEIRSRETSVSFQPTIKYDSQKKSYGVGLVLHDLSFGRLFGGWTIVQNKVGIWRPALQILLNGSNVMGALVSTFSQVAQEPLAHVDAQLQKWAGVNLGLSFENGGAKILQSSLAIYGKVVVAKLK